MAFPGHSRSLALTCTTPSANDLIGNVHPDRHCHIALEQAPRRTSIAAGPRRSKHFSAQYGTAQETFSFDNDKEAPLGKKLPPNRVTLETDDVGNAPTTSLWVGNVPPDLSNERLKAAFEPYGHVKSVRATSSKHCGFVNFDEIDSAVQAWHACHERDIFGTGVTVYVRYETPPAWLSEKTPSLKRKRASADGSGSVVREVKKPIPTGPRSQMLRGVSQESFKSKQTNISPPPLRRYDTYRPHGHSMDDRPTKVAGERHRHSDVYRPSYDSDNDVDSIDGNVDAQLGGQGSSNHHKDYFPESSISSQKSPTEMHQYRTINSAASHDPHADALHRTNNDVAAQSQGMGIKGLASSRRTSTSVAKAPFDSDRPGLQIKGAATNTKAIFQGISDAMSRNATSPPKVQMIEGSSAVATAPAQKTDYRRQSQSHPQSANPVNQTVSEMSNAASDPPAGATEAKIKKLASKAISNSIEANKVTSDVLESKEILGFPHLSHLFEAREKQHVAAQKARTMSPLSRVRASSRDTASVKSAQSDPTPIVQSLFSNADLCEKCNTDGSSLALLKCSVLSCSKKIHSICGKHQSFTSSSSAQKTKLVCDICFEDDIHQSTNISKSNLHTEPGNGATQVATSNNVDIAHFSERDVVNRLAGKTAIGPATFFSSGAIKVNLGGSCAGNVESAPPKTSNKSRSVSQVFSEAVPTPDDDMVSKDHATPRTNRLEAPTISSAGPRCPPPTEPRFMRDVDLNCEPHQIAARYKNDVTCPWWRKGNKCVRREEDCMFAHRLTGIESPNGPSTAKDWTCYDFGTTHGCRFSEKECLYSHRDTGLYVGLDGKASKKHLECYWWRFNHRCRYSDAKCTCAHFPTGLVAEEPMPRDTVRRGPSQASISTAPDDDVNENIHVRSPSYSPPPPSATDQSIGQEFHQNPPAERSAPIPAQTITPVSRPQLVVMVDTTDPRLRRNVHAEPGGLQADTLPVDSKSGQVVASDPGPNGLLTDGNAPLIKNHGDVPVSKQLTMNPCKTCSKLVFKADICTDCLKANQRRDSGQSPPVNQPSIQDELDILNGELMTTTQTFATPAPKILKRTRSGSSSNMFASKRMRPNITVTRSGASELKSKSNVTPATQPLTLEQLNRRNSEKKTQDNARIQLCEGREHQPAATPMINGHGVVSPDFAGELPLFSSTTIVESPVDMLQQRNLPSQNNFKPSYAEVDDSRRLSPAEPKLKASFEPKLVLPIPGSVTSDGDEYGSENDSENDSDEDEEDDDDEGKEKEHCDSDNESDMPLAALRSREEKPLWSSSTPNYSPQEPRVCSKGSVSQPQQVTRFSTTTFAASTRCRTCVRYHRKCVHNAKGEYDGRKCFDWQQERNIHGVRQKTHYTELERDRIRKVAAEYGRGLQDSSEATDPLIDDSSTSHLSAENVQASVPRSTETHENQKPLQPSAANRMYRVGRASREFATLEESHPPHPKVQQQVTKTIFSVAGKHDAIQSQQIERPNVIDIITRLKAKGVVFEDSDSEDGSDRGQDDRKVSDTRIDPLFYHKQKNRPPTPIFGLRNITKGQGLKFPQLIYRRQMKRNLQLFGNPHKQVDRQIPQQQILAMVQRKDPDDFLAVPQDVEERMTFQEFFGLRRGQEMEPCLGKVSLPRGKATMELAFRERDVEPGLGAWGRERRGNRKDKPVFVVGS